MSSILSRIDLTAKPVATPTTVVPRTLAEWVELHADRFAAAKSEGARLAADALYDLAADLRATGATTAAVHYDRLNTLDREWVRKMGLAAKV